jgi:hypothetical protein
MLPRLSHSLLCTLVLFAVAASLPAHAQTGPPADSPTSTSLSCIPLESLSQGEPIQLVATVTSAGGTPIGNVNFTEDNISIGAAPLNNGTASLDARLYTGINSFVATFPEQNGYAASSASCDIQAGALNLHSSSNPALAFSTITFIAVISINPFPGGSFYFSINGGPQMAANGGGRNPTGASYTTNTLAAGTYNVTATFAPGDDSAPYTATITEVVTAATGDFTVASSPPAFTLRDGVTATSLITATSMNDFHGPVNFSCSLPPSLRYTCTLTPTGVQLLNKNNESATLTLAAAKVPVALSRPRSRIVPPTLLAGLLPLSLLSVAIFAGRRRRALLGRLLCLVVLTLLALSTTACGPDIFFLGTPAGSYPVTITATGTTPGENPITHTLIVTLNITD